MGTIRVESTAVAHNKGGNGGGVTYLMGGTKTGTYNSINVQSINAINGDIDYLRTKSISANDISTIYFLANDGTIQKLRGSELNYDQGYIKAFNADTIKANKLKVTDIDALNAWIETLNSREITTEYLTVTKQAHFFELIIDKIRSVGGQLIITPASCVVDYVYGHTYEGDYVKPTLENVGNIDWYEVYWRAVDEETNRDISNDFMENDQAICQSFNNAQVGTNYNISNKYYWRLVTGILDDAWINLTTGAKTTAPQYSPKNSFEVVMYKTISVLNDVEYDNEIEWKCKAQKLLDDEGHEIIPTNVDWEDMTLGENEVIHGIFDSWSQLYGIEIKPVQMSDNLAVTTKFTLNIKQRILEDENLSYSIPHKINIGIYFTDDTYMIYNNVPIDGNGDKLFELPDANAPIERIIIVSTADVDWHKCHGMKLSNVNTQEVQGYDDISTASHISSGERNKYNSVPTAGDNLVQLGYRGTDEENSQRKSAIIISAYKTVDQGGRIDEDHIIPPVKSPSYAQYMGIDDFNLFTHRGTYIDATGGYFKGNLVSSDGTIYDIDDDLLDKQFYKIVPDYNVITIEGGTVNPSSLSVSFLVPNNADLVLTVPVNCIFQYSINGATATSIVSGQSVSIDISEMTVGQDIVMYLKEYTNGQVGKLYDTVKMTVTEVTSQSGEAGRNGAYHQWAYRNAIERPDTPTSDSTYPPSGWYETATTPDFANGEYTWCIDRTVTFDSNNNPVWGLWSNPPYRITGDDGKEGTDGKYTEFVYHHTTGPWTPSGQDNPNNWTSSSAADANGHTFDDPDYIGPASAGWTDNPQGVGTIDGVFYKYEYQAQRRFNGTGFDSFTTPKIWSSYGEKGQDGDGYEYIFCRNDSEDGPSGVADPTTWGPTSAVDSQGRTWGADDYLGPSGTNWSDDPQGVENVTGHKKEWVSTRKKTNGTWGSFSTAALWAQYVPPGAQGQNGAYHQWAYKNAVHLDASDTPVSDSTYPPTGWTGEPSTPDFTNNEYTWCTDRTITFDTSNNPVYNPWCTPYRISGDNGKLGEDGKYTEFVYKHTTGPWSPSGADDPEHWDASTGPDANGRTFPDEDYIGPTSAGWTDNPQGVGTINGTLYKYEYMTSRRFNGTSFEPFTEPKIWSSYGEKGQDGDGYEYIFTREDSETGPAGASDPSTWGPTSAADAQGRTWANDDYLGPSGTNWTDDPQGVESVAGHKKEWVATRKKKNGTWMPFSSPALWAQYVPAGSQGQNGQFNQWAYKNAVHLDASDTPVSDSTYPPTGWTGEPSTPDFEHGEYTWETMRTISYNVNNNPVYGNWCTPYRISGDNGKAGEDGKFTEFIYKHTTGPWSPSGADDPEHWNASTGPDSQGRTFPDEDYIGPTGAGWSDNPQGVNSTYLYEYMSSRRFNGTTFDSFTEPKIWSSFGSKGRDGDGYEYIFKTFNEEKTSWPSGADTNKYENPANWPVNQNDEYYGPTGYEWSDDPLTLDETNNKYEYVSVRKKKYDAQQDKAVWGPFSTPELWAMYGGQGPQGPTGPMGPTGPAGGTTDQYFLVPLAETFEVRINAEQVGSQAYENISGVVYTELEYGVVHKDGTNITYLSQSDLNNYTLQVIANCSDNNAVVKFTQTGRGTSKLNKDDSSSVTIGTIKFKYSNLLTQMWPNNSTYHNFYYLHTSNNIGKAPIQLNVALINSSSVQLDQTCIDLTFKASHLFSVSDTALNSIYQGLSGTTGQYTQTGMSHIKQTWDNINLSVKNLRYANNGDLEDDTDIEQYIWKRTSSSTAPQTPTSSGWDNTPSGWYKKASYPAPTSSEKYVWISQRTRTVSIANDGSLSYGTPTLWSDPELYDKFDVPRRGTVNTAQLSISADEIRSTVESNVLSQVEEMLTDENSYHWTINLLDWKDSNNVTHYYDENTYYPVGIHMQRNNEQPYDENLICTLQVDRTLNEDGFGGPNWGSTMNNIKRGVALMCQWTVIPSRWGTWGDDSITTNPNENTYGNLYVDRYILKWTGGPNNPNDENNTQGVKVIGNLEEHNPSSTMIFYLRGGSKYNLRSTWSFEAKNNQGQVVETGMNWDANRVISPNASYTTQDPNRDPKTYSSIVGADSDDIKIPVQDRQSKSEIIQTANEIAMNVYEETDEGLKKTGIDITSGQINLNSDNTNVNGTLNIYNPNCGFQVWDQSNQNTVQIRNDKMGQIKDYQFTGAKTYNISKSGSKGNTDTSTPFTVSFDKVNIGNFSSTLPCKIVALAWCGIENTSNNSSVKLKWVGSNKTITKVEWKVEILNSSDNVVKTETYTFNTYDATTQAFYGYPFNTDIEYTPSSSGILYVRSTMRMWTQGAGNGPCNYNAWYSFDTYTQLTGAQRISVDGAIFTSGNSGVNYEYAWWGKYKNPSRTADDYAFLVRNRNHNFKVTPIGIMRTMMVDFMMPDASESAQWLVNDQLTGSNAGAAKWCDISSCVPVLNNTSGSSYNLATATTNGTPTIAQIGLICNTGSSDLTVNLPDPAKWPGKKLLFKGVNKSIKFTCDKSNGFVADDDTSKRNTIDFTTTTGCLISNGSYWIHFNSN